MKAFQNQTAALRMPLSAFGAVRRPLFWMECAFLLTVWLLLALPGWAVLPAPPEASSASGGSRRGALRHFLPLLALFSLLGLAVVLCHRWLAQAPPAAAACAGPPGFGHPHHREGGAARSLPALLRARCAGI